MKKVVLNVSGMSCGHCEARIIKALAAMDGVTKVTASAKNSEVSFDYEGETTPIEKMKAIIDDLGFTLIGVK